MEREPDPGVSARITRRKILAAGAKLGGALLWTAPIIQTTGIRPAFALGSGGPGCEGVHPARGRAEGIACTEARALAKLEPDADNDGNKFCKKKIDSCRAGKCRLVSRGPLVNVACAPHNDKNCRSGQRWKCVGTLTTVTCSCR